MPIQNMPEVEHIQPQHNNDDELKTCWENFLLSCRYCNRSKGHTQINDTTINNYFWPHRDNTFRAFCYSEGGLINPSDQVTTNNRLLTIANNTIRLTGLDKDPGNANQSRRPTIADNRWSYRQETWNIAQRALVNLHSNDCDPMRNQIADSAAAYGFWSIWMTVFEHEPDMLQRFISAFSGTCSTCFDENNNYAAIQRNGGQL
jgi:hypothetical protein